MQIDVLMQHLAVDHADDTRATRPLLTRRWQVDALRTERFEDRLTCGDIERDR